MKIYEVCARMLYYWADAYETGYKWHEKFFSTKEKAEQYAEFIKDKYFDRNNQLATCETSYRMPECVNIYAIEVEE